MALNHVPVPRNMRDLPVSSNGFIKPWFVKDEDFRVVDERKAADSLTNRKCWICGKRNEGSVAFVTGWKSAKHMMATEPPCHVKCAEYALKVCPYIITPGATRRDAGLSPEELEHSPVQEMRRHGVYVMTVVDSYTITSYGGMTLAGWKKRYIKRRIAWYEGSMVTWAEASGIVEESLP